VQPLIFVQHLHTVSLTGVSAVRWRDGLTNSGHCEWLLRRLPGLVRRAARLVALWQTMEVEEVLSLQERFAYTYIMIYIYGRSYVLPAACCAPRFWVL
jgi:hypothetical protein